jgi:hypothetical protein
VRIQACWRGQLVRRSYPRLDSVPPAAMVRSACTHSSAAATGAAAAAGALGGKGAGEVGERAAQAPEAAATAAAAAAVATGVRLPEPWQPAAPWRVPPLAAMWGQQVRWQCRECCQLSAGRGVFVSWAGQPVRSDQQSLTGKCPTVRVDDGVCWGWVVTGLRETAIRGGGGGGSGHSREPSGVPPVGVAGSRRCRVEGGARGRGRSTLGAEACDGTAHTDAAGAAAAAAAAAGEPGVSIL